MQDTYQLTHTYQKENEKNCCIVRIFSPVISAEEEEQRMKNIKDTVSVYMTEVYRIRKKGKIT